MLTNIQGLVGSNLNDTFIGDGANNFLFGSGGVDTLIGGGGADVLNGGDGNDFLVGGDGGDLYDGGNDYDIVSYADAPTGVVIDMTNALAGTGFALGDTYTSIEQINLNDFGNNLSGDANANTFVGGAGNDVLNGRGGADFLFGGGGDDVIMGGEGADLINGEGGNNTAAYSFATAGVTADLQFGSAAGTAKLPATATTSTSLALPAPVSVMTCAATRRATRFRVARVQMRCSGVMAMIC